MEIQTLISFGIGLVAIAAFFGAMLGVQRLAVNGKDPGNAIKTAGVLVDGVKALNDSVGKLVLPGAAENIIDRILQVAQSGVHQAEQLYNSGNLPPDLRKDQAVNYALNLLQLEGRKITPELEAALRGAVEDAVFLMKQMQPPKTSVNEAQTAQT